MKINDIIYYVDKSAKFYFDVKLLEVIYNNEFNINLYKCEILYNNYKFNDKNFKPNFDLKGKKDVFNKKLLCETIDEAENKIK